MKGSFLPWPTKQPKSAPPWKPSSKYKLQKAVDAWCWGEHVLVTWRSPQVTLICRDRGRPPHRAKRRPNPQSTRQVLATAVSEYGQIAEWDLAEIMSQPRRDHK